MNRRRAFALAVLAPALLLSRATCGVAAGAEGELPPALTGVVPYAPPVQEDATPQRFRLPPHEFKFAEQPLRDVSDRIAVSLVTFPSPVETPHPNNNTVHCEFYRPKRAGKAPAVVVLHILGGDFPLARLFCNSIAHRGAGALLVKMPYYGPRRPQGVSRRMISRDPRETVESMTQAILDIRRAAAWLAARDDVDAEQIGVFGISLGGITGGLAATAEPRFNNVCLMLAGGDIGQIAWESPAVAETRQAWESAGGTREEFFELLGSIDPARYGENVHGRRILMLNATEDEVIPRACTDALWRSFGEPEIQWYEGGHYTVARHILKALDRVPEFFAPAGEKAAMSE